MKTSSLCVVGDMVQRDESGNNRVAIAPQLEAWTGQFGDEYVNRNDYADWKMEPGTEAFRRILGGLDIESVLEVGSNIGLNLLFINALFKGSVKLYAVEPNPKAFDKLVSQTRMKLEKAWNCDAFQLPLPDSSIDLVFTAGVLIHIASDDLGRATGEIVRVARKYVLCIEYFSHTPVEVPYRGQMGLLFKRDFGAFYLDRFPLLKCVNYGFLWQREFRIFDNLNWWLFEK
ncbi:MAG: methyltransferase domain-containing protein [Chloroflexi bacterium]|nr:methyltransferase domain-containing protein [Chloroflexota bacterium]